MCLALTSSPPMYFLLSPIKHIALIIVWGVIVSLLLLVVHPHIPNVIVIVGGIFGLFCGLLQHLSYAEAPHKFVIRSPPLEVLEVRQLFKSSVWGKRYIWLINWSGIFLIALASGLIRWPLLQVFWGCLLGFASLGFVRELITLQDSFRRRRG